MANIQKIPLDNLKKSKLLQEILQKLKPTRSLSHRRTLQRPRK